jgi:predicted nicotinamide N-methyase
MNNVSNTTHLDVMQRHVQGLFNASIQLTKIPELDLKFYLMDPSIEARQYSPEQVDEIWGSMPYWAFTWSSGRALAKYILDHPELVKDKTVCDFGSGSGVVALAAMKAGAKSAWACDIDSVALLSCQQNAKVNSLVVSVCEEISQVPDLDILVVGDVLYDPRNHKLAETLFNQNLPVIWAESRAQTKLSHRGPVAVYQAQTQPNIGGFDEHKDIHIYHHKI